MLKSKSLKFNVLYIYEYMVNLVSRKLASSSSFCFFPSSPSLLQADLLTYYITVCTCVRDTHTFFDAYIHKKSPFKFGVHRGRGRGRHNRSRRGIKKERREKGDNGTLLVLFLEGGRKKKRKD